MIEVHQRAARISNAPGVSWHTFVMSRFAGHMDSRAGDTSIAIEMQSATQPSSSHAELRGLFEYRVGASLPLVFEIVATLDLETREVRIDDAQGSEERSYTGRLSENGRVLSLRSRAPGKSTSKALHLVEESTRRELLCE
jgi:hypothetical protein